MYAQRGHGKRSSFYSDYTFGVWATARAARTSWCRSARPTSASPTRNFPQIDKFVRAQHRSTASARCARSRTRRTRASCWRWRSRPAALDAPQVRRRDALSPHQPRCAGTSRRARRTGWRRWKRCWRERSRAPPRCGHASYFMISGAIVTLTRHDDSRRRRIAAPTAQVASRFLGGPPLAVLVPPRAAVRAGRRDPAARSASIPATSSRKPPPHDPLCGTWASTRSAGCGAISCSARSSWSRSGSIVRLSRAAGAPTFSRHARA